MVIIMIILAFLLIFVPALISVLLYERFKGYNLTMQKRVMLLLIFAFLINMIWFAITWARGWEFQSWASDSESSLTSTVFVLQHKAISLVSGVVLAYILSLVRVSKRDVREKCDDKEKRADQERCDDKEKCDDQERCDDTEKRADQEKSDATEKRDDREKAQ